MAGGSRVTWSRRSGTPRCWRSAPRSRPGLDILTDGEERRESYSNRFATALDGVDIDNPGTALDRSGHPNPVPRVTGPIQRRHPVEVDDVAFLRANTDRMVKMTVPGPFTMSQQAQDDHYSSPEDLALAYAEAVNEEVRDLFAAGADIVQLDEPYLQARPEQARKYGVKAINRALEEAPGPRRCTCASATPRSSTTARGLLVPARAGRLRLRPDLDRDRPVRPGHLGPGRAGRQDDHPGRAQPGRRRGDAGDVVARVRRALEHVPAERLILAPDCGMKYLPREAAYGKLKAMTTAAARLRAELGS